MKVTKISFFNPKCSYSSRFDFSYMRFFTVYQVLFFFSSFPFLCCDRKPSQVWIVLPFLRLASDIIIKIDLWKLK